MIPVGIDLGTTNSVVAYYKKGEAQTVEIEGSVTVPSVVYIKDGKIEVGKKAKGRVLISPDQTLSSTKRMIGSNWSKKIDGKTYTPIDAAREVLSYLVTQAEATLGDKIEDVVITIPAYFNDDQRRDTRIAAEQAGLNVLRLLPEPTAAAIAYGFNQEKDQSLLVFDLGGGTFDVSILEIKNNDFTVKAVDGNHQLGGDDFDNAIVGYLNDWIKDNTGESVKDDNLAQQKLKEIAEEVKIELSAKNNAEIIITNVTSSIDVEIDRFKRNEFEALIEPHLNEMMEKTKSVIEQAGLSPDDINRIVLVGGSSKTPAIEERLKDQFRQPYKASDMDVSVAKGAALVCASLSAATDLSGAAPPVDLNFKDVISHSLGVDMRNEKNKIYYVPILAKNTHYPTKGACMGYAEAWQEKVVMTVYRGESVDVKQNLKLGKLELEISKEFLGDNDVPVCGIFELDKNGELTLTEAEMPVTSSTKYDIAALANSMKDNLIPWEEAKGLIEKHKFKTKQVKLKADK